MSTNSNHNNQRIYAIEFWRFVFILFVCLLHFEEDNYNCDHILASKGYLGVDFFFLLSGLGLALNYAEKKVISPISYISKRLKKLYPSYVLAIILMLIAWMYFESNGPISILKHIYNNSHQFLLLNAIDNSTMEMRSLWFVSCWIWGLFLCVVLVENKAKWWG